MCCSSTSVFGSRSHGSPAPDPRQRPAQTCPADSQRWLQCQAQQCPDLGVRTTHRPAETCPRNRTFGVLRGVCGAGRGKVLNLWRSGPRHWGQSSAPTGARSAPTTTAIETTFRIARLNITHPRRSGILKPLDRAAPRTAQNCLLSASPSRRHGQWGPFRRLTSAPLRGRLSLERRLSSGPRAVEGRYEQVFDRRICVQHVAERSR